MKPNLAIGLAIGALAYVTGGPFRLSAQEKSQWDGVYSAEQAQRGQALYGQHCSSCHGPELAGGEMAPGLVGGDFAANWDDLTLGQLFDRIRTSMPQNNPGALSPQQNSDILSFMLLKGNAPAGTTELPAQSEVLNTIKYLATNPNAK